MPLPRTLPPPSVRPDMMMGEARLLGGRRGWGLGVVGGPQKVEGFGGVGSKAAFDGDGDVTRGAADC